MDKVLTLLDLQKKARDAANIQELGFVLVNNTHRLLPYTQAIFWSFDGQNIKLETVSGNASIEQKSAYAIWLASLIKDCISKNAQDAIAVSGDTIEEAKRSHWSQWCGPYGLIAPFRTHAEGIVGGLWLERAQPFHDAEMQVLVELSQSYAQSLALWKLRSKKVLLPDWRKLKRHQKWVLMVLALACVFPVRLSVNAPAEIVAENPQVLGVPYDGVLEHVDVRPGDVVKKGQILAKMDKATLQGQMDMAEQALGTAQDAFSRLSREALKTPEKKIELNQVQSEIRARQIEYDHTKTLLDRSNLASPAYGVAIFSDANVLEGRPVRIGEKIMLVADPNDSEVLIRIPVDAMIPLDQKSPVRFFLNVSPLGAYEAEIISIGYQASPDPDGLLTYKVRAKLTGIDEGLRIGWKGSAKLQGGWSILPYAMLRRPLITARNIMGF